MKLAIEYLQSSIAVVERALLEAKGGQSIAQRQVDEYAAAVDLNQRKLADYRAALVELRKPSAPEAVVIADQIKKTELQERKPLSLKAKN